jgi:hypothetical protein
MKLTNKILKQLIREAVFDYKSSLDRRQEKYKGLDPAFQKKLDPMLVHSDPSVQAQGHELVDTLTGYERSGTEDIEGLKIFNLGQLYHMIPGLEEMGRSDIRDHKNFHDKLLQVLQSDTILLYLHMHEPNDEQGNRIDDTGVIMPEDVDNLYFYALHAKPSVSMTQDLLFNGLTVMAGGLDTLPYEKAIIDYVIRHAKNYAVDVLN